VGTGHSSMPLVPTDGVIVSLDRMQGLAPPTPAGARLPCREFFSDIEPILRDHEGAPVAICGHPDPNEGSEASAIMFSMVAELEEGRMWVAPGNPCQNDYREIDLAGVW